MGNKVVPPVLQRTDEIATILQDVLDEMETEATVCRGYSGRGMMGKFCLGVSCSPGELWVIANRMGLRNIILTSPHTDSMGRDIIAYWPGLEDRGYTPSADDYEGED